MKRYTFLTKKLVRDNVPNVMESNNISFDCEACRTDEQFRNALIDKVIEEILEVKEAVSIDKKKHELADVLEVFLALLQSYNVSMDEIEQVRQEILAEKGGFDKRIYCHTFTMDADNPVAQKYLQSSHKYPRVSWWKKFWFQK